MHRRLLVALLFVAGVVALARAQQQPPPTFRARADLVVVDVQATDATGRPVVDLKPEDFIVAVDGKPRPVAVADFVSYPLTAATPADARRASGSVPAMSDNRTVETVPSGRIVLLVFDEENIRGGEARKAADAAEGFLRRAQPQDRIGLVSIPTGRAGIDPTTNRAAVVAALRTVAGHLQTMETQLGARFSLGVSEAFALYHDKRKWEEVIRRECGRFSNGDQQGCRGELEHYAHAIVTDARQRAFASVRALAGLLSGLAALPGPKTVILITQELPVSSYLPEQRDFVSESSALSAAAARAQARIYVLQLDVPLADVTARTPPPTTTDDAAMRSDGLETVTSLTGGRRMMVAGRADGVFERITLELSGYYLLGIRPEAADRDGKPHEIKVTAKRPGLDVRARPHFVFTDAGSPPLAASDATAVVSRLLRSGDAAAAIPVAVATYVVPRAPAPGNPPQLGVVVTAEIDGREATPGEMAIGFTLLDATGRDAGATVEKAVLAPAEGQGSERLCYLAMSVVPPGGYTLRFAVADEGLRSGVVTHRFVAAALALPDLKVSDLIVLDPNPMSTGKPRPSVRAVVTDELTCYFEAHQDGATPIAGLAASLELADTEDGAPRAAAEMTMQPGGERWLASGALAVGGLPPGDYVARAVITRNASVVGRIFRPVRIVR